MKAADVLTDGSLTADGQEEANGRKIFSEGMISEKKKRFSTDLRKGRKKNIIVTYFDSLMDTV